MELDQNPEPERKEEPYVNLGPKQRQAPPPPWPYPYLPRPTFWSRLKRSLLVMVLMISLALNCMLLPTMATLPLAQEVVFGNAEAPNTVALISLDGVIMEEEDGMWSGSSTYQWFEQQIDRASEDPSVKAVIVEIDSPGGGVTASDTLYRKLRKLAQTKKTVCLMGGIAASGGYYVACAADYLMAQPTTVTGSIGVIISSYDMSKLMNYRLGIEEQTIKSGPKKDILSPFRPMTEDEREMLSGIVSDMYETFLSVVATNRKFKLEPDQVRALADGSIFTAKQAKENGLIDDVGYLEDAVAKVRELAKLSSEDTKVVKYKKDRGFLSLLSARLATPPERVEVSVPFLPEIHGPRFLYLWRIGSAY